MPQLPGGRHIGLSHDRVLAWAEQVGYGELLLFSRSCVSDERLWDVVDVVYFGDAEGEPTGEGLPPGKPFLSGMTVEDVLGPGSAWAPADKAWFREWLALPRAVEWFGALRKEVGDRLDRKELPPALVGLFDVDD